MQGLEPPSLVLLDELGAGTDPGDGGALGVSIIDHFQARPVPTSSLRPTTALSSAGPSRRPAFSAPRSATTPRATCPPTSFSTERPDAASPSRLRRATTCPPPCWPKRGAGATRPRRASRTCSRSSSASVWSSSVNATSWPEERREIESRAALRQSMRRERERAELRRAHREDRGRGTRKQAELAAKQAGDAIRAAVERLDQRARPSRSRRATCPRSGPSRRPRSPCLGVLRGLEQPARSAAGRPIASCIPGSPVRIVLARRDR